MTLFSSMYCCNVSKADVDIDLFCGRYKLRPCCNCLSLSDEIDSSFSSCLSLSVSSSSLLLSFTLAFVAVWAMAKSDASCKTFMSRRFSAGVKSLVANTSPLEQGTRDKT